MIDVKEWKAKYHLAVTGLNGMTHTEARIAFLDELIRAVIADERQPEPPATKPGVPEWQKQIAIRIRDRIRATGCWSAEFVEQVVREECEPLEAEIARRVKEATNKCLEHAFGALVRKLYDAAGVPIGSGAIVDVVSGLRQQLAERDAECEKLKAGNGIDEGTIKVQEDTIASLERQLADVRKDAKSWKSEYTMFASAWAREIGEGRQKTHLIDTLVVSTRDMKTERDNLRQQLAAAQVERDNAHKAAKVNKAEVERLKEWAQETLDKRHAEAVAKISRMEARAVKAEAELEEARKPVEDADVKAIFDKTRPENGQLVLDWLCDRFQPLLQRERNARLAAERERDELRALTNEISKVADKAIKCCYEGQDVWAGVESIRRSIAAFRSRQEGAKGNG
jgi:chromosome segregation ATPase